MSERHDLAANKKTIERFLLALAEMRVEDARALMSPDCECILPTVSLKPNVFDREGMLGFIDTVKKAIPAGIRFEIVEMTAEDNRVSSIANGYSTTVDGTEYNNRYHFLHYLEDGRIVLHMEYFDSFLGARVLGPLLQRLMGKG